MNRFVQNIVLGGVSLLLASCAVDPDVKPDAPITAKIEELQGVPLWLFCSEKNALNKNGMPFNRVADEADVIFTGKVLERRLNFDGTPPLNGCLVKMRTLDVLKGKLNKEIWLRAFYSHNSIEHDKPLSYDQCYLELGKEYFISGRQRSSSNGKVVVVAKDNSAKQLFVCLPVQKLSESKDIISFIKNINHGGRYGSFVK